MYIYIHICIYVFIYTFMYICVCILYILFIQLLFLGFNGSFQYPPAWKHAQRRGIVHGINQVFLQLVNYLHRGVLVIHFAWNSRIWHICFKKTLFCIGEISRIYLRLWGQDPENWIHWFGRSWFARTFRPGLNSPEIWQSLYSDTLHLE